MSERASAENPGAVEETPGKRDAAAARAAFKAGTVPPAPRRGRGRPARPVVPPAPSELPGGGEDPAFWGGQLQTLWNSFARQRGYAPIPDEAVPKIGMSAALVAEKWGPQQTKYPELLLLVMLAPYLASAVTVELRRIRESDNAKRRKEPSAAERTPATQKAPTDRATTRALDVSELESD